MMPIFEKTAKQSAASKLMKGKARHIMLYGGGRSGKTFIAVYSMIVRACKEKSRHVVLRQNFNHVKTSIWLDTLPKVLSLCFPDLKLFPQRSDYYMLFPNGSELWFAGLDDKDRVEKILGKEYSTMFFNECSQIPYESVQLALTRLAEKNVLVKKAFYDENPPSKKHWSYWVFVKGINPEDGNQLDRNMYRSILMNPEDNINNIDPDYITEILDKLSEKQKLRFKYGEFTDDGDGLAYYSFDNEMHVKSIQKDYKIGTVLIGMDFNVMPMTAIICNYVNNIFYIHDELFLENSNTFHMTQELLKRGYAGAWIYPDSTGKNRKTSGKSDHLILEEAGFTIKGTRNPLVFDRINNINRLLRDGSIVIDPKCKKLINDLNKVAWNGHDLEKKSDPMLTHISDALGYLCWAVDRMSHQTPQLTVKHYA